MVHKPLNRLQQVIWPDEKRKRLCNIARESKLKLDLSGFFFSYLTNLVVVMMMMIHINTYVNLFSMSQNLRVSKTSTTRNTNTDMITKHDYKDNGHNPTLHDTKCEKKSTR
ncbi:NADH-quinone oxidoreductase subunit N [Striga asiatica]|uniref:NADH-quinone oxidoreductase subunit N n=1 Tax=Striga asiatica TaxID=4170 RepID=A0A5A7R828_STRAF|nr:NADH-quinone oxidoreductase subunit N [Striga asiatica]